MCTYLMSKEARWMIKARNTSLLVMIRTQKATSLTILISERQSSIEMLYSVKKEKWIRDNRMKTTTSFHTLKKTI